MVDLDSKRVSSVRDKFYEADFEPFFLIADLKEHFWD